MTENATARLDLPVVRRMTYFWLAVIIAMLTIGCAKASSGSTGKSEDVKEYWHPSNQCH